MNKTILSGIFFVATLFFIQSNANAYQVFHHHFDKRQNKQTHHIQQGFRQGLFTFQELKELIITQHKLQKLSARYIKDGRYGHREKQILKKKMHQLDKKLKRMRYNKDRQVHYHYGKRIIKHRRHTT